MNSPDLKNPAVRERLLAGLRANRMPLSQQDVIAALDLIEELMAVVEHVRPREVSAAEYIAHLAALKPPWRALNPPRGEDG